MDAHAKWNSIPAVRGKSRLSLKKLSWLGLACVMALAATGYGYYWWTGEASTLAYADAFRAVVATLLVPLMRNVVAPPAQPAEAH